MANEIQGPQKAAGLSIALIIIGHDVGVRPHADRRQGLTELLIVRHQPHRRRPRRHDPAILQMECTRDVRASMGRLIAEIDDQHVMASQNALELTGLHDQGQVRLGNGSTS